jgi:glutamate-1-semialdehyde 2,1-aminomutase
MNRERSKRAFEEAQRIMPGGVNSPVRAFRAVGGNPIFISHAKGSKIYDIDGNEYIDYICSWGPMILGHAHPDVLKGLYKSIEKGTSFGASTILEVELANMIIDAFPSIDMVRMVNSGTEAVMSAIRLARGFTGRNKIVKFEGCYHGHCDSLLVKAGSGALTFGVPDSLGVPKDFTKYTINLPFNDIDSVKEIIRREREDISAIIIEPVAGNMGVVPPNHGFLKELREITYENGILLIFDEVITGFRVSYGGAQELYDIKADITCLGKIIGGGLPVGAYGGRREIMEKVSPLGGVYQAGTLSGNPVAMTAGIETLKVLSKPKIYEELEEKSKYLYDGIIYASKKVGIPIKVNRVGSMLTIFFTDKDVNDYNSAKLSDLSKYKAFFRNMIDTRINIAPSQFEAAFISLSHSKEDLDNTINAIEKAFKSIKN